MKTTCAIRGAASAAMLAIVSLALSACGPMTITVGDQPDHGRLVPNVIESDEGHSDNRIAVVDVAGTIYNSTKAGLLSPGENPVGLLEEKLEAARRDDHVRAVILRLNTPGGTVTASDAMYREVLRFKEQCHKPVIALMMDVTASGGYYLACSADEIVTYPTSVTGSIGVIAQTFSIKPALTRWGIETEAIVSGKNKEIASPLSTLTDEQRAILQGLVNDFYQRFLGVVRKARPNIPPDQFAQLTDGRVMSGERAVTVGLADRTGDLHDAFAVAKERAGIKHADLVLYKRPFYYANSPYAQGPNAPSGSTQINLAQFNLQDLSMESSAGFYYMWQPDLSNAAASVLGSSLSR